MDIDRTVSYRPPVKGGSERFLRAGGFAFLKTNPPLRLRLTALLTGGQHENERRRARARYAPVAVRRCLLHGRVSQRRVPQAPPVGDARARLQLSLRHLRAGG